MRERDGVGVGGEVLTRPQTTLTRYAYTSLILAVQDVKESTQRDPRGRERRGRPRRENVTHVKKKNIMPAAPPRRRVAVGAGQAKVAQLELAVVGDEEVGGLGKEKGGTEGGVSVVCLLCSSFPPPPPSPHLTLRSRCSTCLEWQ